MENNNPKRREDVKDPIGKLGWPKQKGGDGERTPMQWNASENAGFSRATPWNPVGPRFVRYNVASETEDPDSILNFYCRLLTMRHTNEALREGIYMPLDERNPNVLSYLRRSERKKVLVVLNMSSATRTVRVPMRSANTLIASSPDSKMTRPGEVSVEPFGAYVGEGQ